MSVQPQGGDVPAWTLGDRLRKAREHAGLKQSELADQIGIARSSIVNYESGRYEPSRPVLLSWALRCGVDYGWLTGFPRPAYASLSPAIPTGPLHIDMADNSILCTPMRRGEAGLAA